MEDQQPDPDDLIAERTDKTGARDRQTAAGNDSQISEKRFGDRSLRRWPAAAVVAASALFVGAGAFTGAALQPYLAGRAESASRLEIAQTAAAMVSALWTYTPETVDTLGNRASEFLSGDFDAQYRKFAQAIATPNKEAQITNRTDVVGVAVESLKGSDAVAIVFTNTTATSPLTQDIPSLKYVSYRLAMKQQGSQWRVTDMSTISFMDLTPKL